MLLLSMLLVVALDAADLRGGTSLAGPQRMRELVIAVALTAGACGLGLST